jgi:hypothetical protein
MTVRPDQGTTQGSTHVTITGGPWDEQTLWFTMVFFDKSPATDVKGKDQSNDKYTSISAVSPPHNAGIVDITVITPDGPDLRKNAFTYKVVKVESVEPNEGAKEGEFAVIITGYGFTDVQEVKFGEEKSRRFAVTSPSEIWAVVPPVRKPTGVEVTVKTPDGHNTESPKFTYR